MTEIEPMPWHTSALDKQITTLITAGNALSLMAQTSGGTAGRDDALCAAVDRWDAEREKAIQARRIVRYEWNDPEIGVGFESVSLPRTPTASSEDEVERVALAIEDQLTAEDGWMVGTPAVATMCRDFAQAAIAAMRPARGELADELDYALRSALRFAASRSAITAAEEKAILAALRQAGEG